MTEKAQKPQKDILIKSLIGLSNLAPQKPVANVSEAKPATANETQKKEGVYDKRKR